MANLILEILSVFFLIFMSSNVLMYRHSKSAFLQITLNFELELMNISSSRDDPWTIETWLEWFSIHCVISVSYAFPMQTHYNSLSPWPTQ